MDEENGDFQDGFLKFHCKCTPDCISHIVASPTVVENDPPLIWLRILQGDAVFLDQKGLLDLASTLVNYANTVYGIPVDLMIKDGSNVHLSPSI